MTTKKTLVKIYIHIHDIYKCLIIYMYIHIYVYIYIHAYQLQFENFNYAKSSSKTEKTKNGFKNYYNIKLRNKKLIKTIRKIL